MPIDKTQNPDLATCRQHTIPAGNIFNAIIATLDQNIVMKRAAQAIDELRRQLFFRGGPQMMAIGRGKRWLFLRAWEKCTPPTS